jgi:hypothetical protein
MLGEVKGNLKRCGYSEPLLHAGYSYEDGLGKHTVPLAGFASSVHDARTSCVSVIDCDGLRQVTKDYIYQFRGLGAPVVFVCCQKTLQWWTIGTRGAEFRATHSEDEIAGFFAAHRTELTPDRISRAKNLGNIVDREQLHFVDAGLMWPLEHEMGERLGGLMRRVLDSLRGGLTEQQLEKAESERWIFRTAFWLLCAKILKDKGVRNFAGLQIDDVDAVLDAVRVHYGAQVEIGLETSRQRNAIEEAAGNISKFASLSNLTTEAFGYMYETLFVDKKSRSALGIHATPSYLVDYIVWQLWPWIKQIPEDRRIVLEPACGHAPFLTGAMRLLRELFEGDAKAFHKYAKRNLVGIEVDSFAREIARLSLTMADVPNPNGWKIMEGDIYRSNVLRDKAKNATILLCNPPFENFTPKEQDDSKTAGEQLKFYNKAAEMLWRTLPFMPEESVFGVILPQGFLHKTNLAKLRETILRDFELSQLCTLPENVFTFAGHMSALLLGRKRIARSKRSNDNEILYRRVPKEGLERFKEKYEAQDQCVVQSKFDKGPAFEMRIRELGDIWDYCERNYPALGLVVRGGQGFSFEGKDLPDEKKTFGEKRFAGSVEGYVSIDGAIQLHELPRPRWINLESEVIQRRRWGTETGERQILMNHARTGSGPWRIKAWIDNKGRPAASAFLVFRIQDDSWSLLSLWAILNSPLANAYVYCSSMERNNSSGTVEKIPIPFVAERGLQKLEQLVCEYFSLMKKKDSEFGVDVQDAAKRLLLLIDAEVMRLYDLPPKMEKRVLDLFQGVQRKGVDFDFKGYYPEGFESAVPLHELLSEEYLRSTVSFVKKWVEENRSPEVIKAFEVAVDAFQDE